MHKATFKITSHIRSIAIFLAVYLGLLLGGKDLLQAITKENEALSPTLLISLTAAIIFAAYLYYITGKPRLVISSSGIALTQLPFNIGTWSLAWKDTHECLLIFAPMGGHKFLLKNAVKDRLIAFPLWALDETTLNIKKDTSPFFKFSRNRPPEEFAIYHAIKYFQPNMREASSREATELVQKQFDLGKEAGVVSGGAAFMVLLGLFAGIMNKSRVLDSGYLDIFCGALAIVMGVYAFIYMKKCPYKSANLFISLLFIGCTFWGTRSLIYTATYYAGTEKTFEYSLDKDTIDHQEWKNLENTKLSFDIYADKSNRTYTNLQGNQRVIIKQGIFKNYCIDYDTLNSFTKDPTKRRSRRQM